MGKVVEFGKNHPFISILVAIFATVGTSIYRGYLGGIRETAAWRKGNLSWLWYFPSDKEKARVGRNPQTGGTIQIPAKKVPKFVPGKNLKNKVK